MNSMPKYLNSPGIGSLQQEGQTCMGSTLHLTPYEEMERLFLGRRVYGDVISAHQAGHTNVVATLGTALTTEQARVVF